MLHVLDQSFLRLRVKFINRPKKYDFKVNVIYLNKTVSDETGDVCNYH